MVVQLLQYQEGRAVRRCLSLDEIAVDAQANITYHELYRWNPKADTFERNYYRSRVLDDIAYARGWTRARQRNSLRCVPTPSGSWHGKESCGQNR